MRLHCRTPGPTTQVLGPSVGQRTPSLRLKPGQDAQNIPRPLPKPSREALVWTSPKSGQVCVVGRAGNGRGIGVERSQGQGQGLDVGRA